MKQTNKILLIFITMILLCLIGFIYFTFDNDMVVPNPYIEYDIVRNINISDFNEIEIRGNRLSVDIIRADTFGIRIEGPDNLVNNYLSITKDENKLLFNVSHEIKESFYNINLEISLPRLKRLCADNSNHPIRLVSKNNAYGPAPMFFGRIEIKLKNLKEDDLNIEISGQTNAHMDSCQINNLNADANNISLITIQKSNINSLEYHLTGSSSMQVLNFEGSYNGTLSDYSSISLTDNKNNSEVYYSETLNSAVTSFGEVFPGLHWGSPEKKVIEFFTDRGAVIDISHTFPNSIYGFTNINFNNWTYWDLNIESVSAFFSNNILTSFQFTFHDSLSTFKIDSTLVNYYGLANYERKKSKTWKISNNDSKQITGMHFIYINTNVLSKQSSEWFELQEKMYTSRTGFILEKIDNE